MATLNGWVKMHRRFLEWEWYLDYPTKVVFIHLLLRARWDEGYWKKVKLQRGQIAIGRKTLAKETGLSEQQVRTALAHLKSTNEITIESTNRFSVITIVNYDLYQSEQIESTNESTSEMSRSQPQIKKKEIKNSNYISIYITEIVNYLNETTGKSFRATQKVKGLLADLIDNGYSVDDAKRVIDKKSKDWLGTVYEPGLSPKSLFDADKFDSYLNESKAVKKADVKQLKNELAWLQITWNEEGLSAEQEQRMHELEELLNDIA